MSYLIVIPAYNAAATIADVLGRLNGHRAHTVVVDDGSTDATPHIVRGLGAELGGMSPTEAWAPLSRPGSGMPKLRL